jgi:hypothetical protein
MNWRDVLKDRSHPLYPAAWLLFGQRVDPDYAAEKLANYKDELIPHLKALITDPTFYSRKSLGNGFVPERVSSLLMLWREVSALPEWIKMSEIDVEDMIFDPAWHVMEVLDEIAEDIPLEDLRAEIRKQRDVNNISMLYGVMAKKRDDGIWEELLAQFDQHVSDATFMVVDYASYLLEFDRKAALSLMKPILKNKKIAKAVRESIEMAIFETKP